MNKEWSLDVLYKGYDDENYQKDKGRLDSLIKEINDFCSNLSGSSEEENNLLKAVDYMEQLQLLGSRMGCYVYSRQSVNTSDAETANEINYFDKKMSTTTKPLAVMKKFIAGIENLESYYGKHQKLKGYEYLFSEFKKEAEYLLGDDVEEVIARMNISAASAWGNMQSFLTSTLEVEYRDGSITLSEVRNKAYDEDETIRKDAFVSELKALEKIKDAISYALNNIKTQVTTVCELRGYESPLEMTLIESKMKRETLDALLEAIREFLPAFHRYLKHKAKLLGHEKGLPWYDLFAPLGESNRKFTVEESRNYLISHFKSFNEELADMVAEAYDNEWIDFYPRKGKVGGAFCENMPFVKQSRVLTNFEGSLSDVVTLAHELGHAYHGLNIQEHQPLNVDYSMPVAETASTFNEALIMEAAINEAEGKEKVALIESQLQDITQIICDIYSRYLFETEVFEKSRSGFLFADELKDIMTKAQKEAYGDGLDHDYLHPYMWVVKGHYYSESRNFYNFPYAFGGLFARGLYEKYKQEGQAFIPKYKALLNATTVMSVEDAAKQAEIDLENPGFWRDSLKTVEKLIDEFIRLA
jgi:pepF/M3 family oligoendopeptidase